MRINLTDDFDLHKIADSGQCFRAREFEDGTFRFITGDRALYIRELSKGCYDISCSEEEWQRVWVSYFDLRRSYRRVRRAIPETDPYMRSAARAGRGIRILRQDPWETLVTFIISQRKSIPAIKSTVEALSARFGETVETPRETLYAFPSAEALAAAGPQALRDCKLGYRAPYVQDAAEKVSSGQVDLAALGDLSDDGLLSGLKAIRGVGDKVANCVCLFAYGRVGLAPIDTWIQKTIAAKYGGTDPFPAYGRNAGIMQQYAFYYAITNKEKF